MAKTRKFVRRAFLSWKLLVQTFVFEERDRARAPTALLGLFSGARSSIITVYFIYNTKADFTPVVVTLRATINKRNIER